MKNGLLSVNLVKDSVLYLHYLVSKTGYCFHCISFLFQPNGLLSDITAIKEHYGYFRGNQAVVLCRGEDTSSQTCRSERMETHCSTA